MWGAHTVAQVLAGLDMSNVTTIEFEYSSPDGPMMTRLSSGVKLVLADDGELTEMQGGGKVREALRIR